MIEKKLYTLCALLSLSCSAYAMEGKIDKDDSSSSMSMAGPSSSQASPVQETAEKQSLQDLLEIKQRKKALKKENKALSTELERMKEELKAQIARLKAQIARLKDPENDLEEERDDNKRLRHDFEGTKDRYGYKHF